MKQKFLKTTIVGIVLVMLTANTGYGGHMVSFGIEAGPVFSSAFVEPSSFDPTFKAGLVLGLMTDLRIVDPFYLESGVVWVRNGSDLKISGVTTITTLDYLTIPIRLKWIWDLDLPISPFIFAGLDLGFIMNARGNPDTPIPGFNRELDGGFDAFDTGIDIGAGVNWDVVENIRFLFRVGYTPWLLDVYESNSNLPVNTWRSQDIKVTAGLSLLFGSDSGKKY